MPHTSNYTCECEHESHFPQMDAVVEDRIVTPPTEHAYGAAEQAVEVRTIYGTFKVCVRCRDQHFPKEYLR